MVKKMETSIPNPSSPHHPIPFDPSTLQPFRCFRPSTSPPPLLFSISTPCPNPPHLPRTPPQTHTHPHQCLNARPPILKQVLIPFQRPFFKQTNNRRTTYDPSSVQSRHTLHDTRIGPMALNTYQMQNIPVLPLVQPLDLPRLWSRYSPPLRSYQRSLPPPFIPPHPILHHSKPQSLETLKTLLDLNTLHLLIAPTQTVITNPNSSVCIGTTFLTFSP